MRTPVMAGNWKMYKTASDTRAYFEKFLPLVRGCEALEHQRDVLVCPPFPSLEAAVLETRGTNVRIGAQNLYWGREGAVTGEVCGAMIQSVGGTHVLIGHSERRAYFNEAEQDVIRKTKAALDAQLTPIVCIGERLAERESGQTQAILEEQVRGGIAPLEPEEFDRIIIAYEPVWAIGTGKTATPEIAEQAHQIIRAEILARFGEARASAVRILYGGSVKPDNVKALMAKEEIDGVLVGGASLDPVSFAAIVNF